MAFRPIRTQRLVIRALRPDDARDLAERRNDPRAAELQNWELPFPEERARAMVESIAAMDGPANEEWWMAVVADADSGATFGDVVVHLSWEGRTAEVGYTLSPDHWGRGFASEAVAALVEYLFDEMEVTRVMGMLHPANVASAQVLERNGLLFEGHTRSSFWLAGEVSDDYLYGMTRQDWESWRSRPRQPPDHVALVEITAANAPGVLALRTHHSQERFVAPVVQSMAEALVPPEVNGAPVLPWLRAIEADDELVGFAMMACSSGAHPEPFLWRLLIDRMHQRRGIGGRTLRLVEDACRSMGDGTLLVSWGDGRGSPGPFYLDQGFAPTGRVVDGEVEARKPL